MRIGGGGVQGHVLSMEEVDRRWRENPLDTTYPHLPWWHRHRWCDCHPAAEHGSDCQMTSVWTRTVYDMEFDPSRGWLMDYFKSGHLWMYCTDCGRKFGEINGSTTAHFCEAIGDVVRA